MLRDCLGNIEVAWVYKYSTGELGELISAIDYQYTKDSETGWNNLLTTVIYKTYTYDEAIDVIKKATKPLGEEYTNLIDRAVKERWIDLYPNENKDSGALLTPRDIIHVVKEISLHVNGFFIVEIKCFDVHSLFPFVIYCLLYS